MNVHDDQLHNSDFEVVRSDQGDGGWSLHWKHDKPDDDGLRPVLVGPSSYDAEHDDWVRPTDEDYADAIEALLAANPTTGTNGDDEMDPDEIINPTIGDPDWEWDVVLCDDERGIGRTWKDEHSTLWGKP